MNRNTSDTEHLAHLDRLNRLSEIGLLAPGLFHDLGTHLSVLALYLERLTGIDAIVAEAKTCVAGATAASKRAETFLKAMVRQLGPDAEAAWFSPAEEVNAAAEALSYKARQAGVTVGTDVDGTPRLFGRALRFHQIALNLLSNAIDACRRDPGSPGTKPLRIVTVTLRANEAGIILEVSDTGTGFGTEARRRLFEPFHTTKGPDHAGLGLFSVREIATRDFGGSVALSDAPEGGSILTVRLPIRSEG